MITWLGNIDHLLGSRYSTINATRDYDRYMIYVIYEEKRR